MKLVLLPGLDGTGVLFRPLLKVLPPDFQPLVIAYPNDKALGYDELLSLVLASLPHDEEFVLLGESFGGPLALRVAATRPSGLKALILCASFVSYPLSFAGVWAAPLVGLIPFRFFPQLSRLRAWFGGYSDAELMALTQESLRQVAPRVFACRTRAVMQVNVTAELVACGVPILYLRGDHDHVVPIANLERILAIKPTVQTAHIPAPHLLLQTRPVEAADAIGKFIRNLDQNSFHIAGSSSLSHRHS